jgi:hypothetical protein
MTSPPADVPRGELILYQTQDGRTRIECCVEDETIWLTRALMAELFQKDVRTINEHLVNLDDEGGLDREATIRRFRIVRTEGNRSVSREGTWTARLAKGSPVSRLVPASVRLARRAPRANVGAVVAPFVSPSAIQRGSSGGGQTAPRCSARCFARHMRSSVSASTSAASSIRRSTSARRSSRAALGSAASNGGAWSMRPPLRLPSRRQSSAFRDGSRLLSASRTHVTAEPSTVAGQLESASLSRRARPKFSESHCERPRRTVRASEPVPIPFTESVRRRRRTRSPLFGAKPQTCPRPGSEPQ